MEGEGEWFTVDRARHVDGVVQPSFLAAFIVPDKSGACF